MEGGIVMDERGALKTMIDRRLEQKIEKIINPETSDNDFFSSLFDVCTLNKLKEKVE
jgi:hypothetical protein